MNFFYQYEPKSISCRRLETKRHSDRNGDFGFRRKAQVRSNTLFIFIKSVPCKGDTTRGKRKLKQGQKTAFPFPLMVSPCLCKRQALTLPYTPIPIRFLSPYILLAAVSEPRSSICTHLYSHVYGLCFTPFFYLLFFFYMRAIL